MAAQQLYEPTWERMIRAVELVKDRCNRAVAALEAAGVIYAVVGGHAVANWVARIDEGAVRNTRDVDILVRRVDLARAIAAMEAAGFVYAEVSGIHLFMDGPEGKPSQGVHLLFAGEIVRPEHQTPAAGIDEAEQSQSFRVVTLEALVRMKLESNRLKDLVHIQDLIGVGLIDESWPSKFPAHLAERLIPLIANPERDRF
jgi:hypothetical protein